jgi:hypothetical protein
MPNSGLGLGKLKDDTRPKLVVEVTGQRRAGTVMIELQVKNAVAKIRQQGGGSLDRG